MSNCSCIYVDVGDLAECFSEDEIKARKEHKCCECGGKIKPGETCYLAKGKWGDRWASYKTCINCKSIRDEFFCEGFNFTVLIWDLFGYLREVEGEVSEECLDNLTEGAKDMVLGYIDEIFEELDEEEDGG